MRRAVLYFRELLTLILIFGPSTFSLTANKDGNLSPEGCPASGQGDFSLNLTGVGLNSLPDGFIDNEFLTHLILNGNQITSVGAKTFAFLPKLSYLSLENNKLSSLDLRQFSELRNLETLILNGNCKPRGNSDYNRPQYAYIKTKLYDPSKFCTLNLNSNLPALRHLFVEDNSLRRISFTSVELPTLTHLYLANNPLKIDKDTLLGLKNSTPALMHLYLNHSGLTEFDASQLPNLTSLYLNENDISSICNEYCKGSSLKLNEVRKLEVLFVSHNNISKIAIDSFNHTVNLTILDLSHNKISEIGIGTFDKLHQLESLSLEDNNLVELSGVDPFKGLLNLKKLFLGCNDISIINREVFQNLDALKVLTLNHNKISSFASGTFSNLTSLQELSLADNRLSKIPERSMPTSGSLTDLNLDNNQFKSVENISIINAPRMLTLSLKDNPLTGLTSRWFLSLPSHINVILGCSCYANNESDTSML